MFKCFFRIWISFKLYIVMIALVAFCTCCAIILYPSFDKFFTNSSRQTQTKFFDSGLNLGKLGVEERLNFCITGPNYRNRVKSLNLRQELTSENSSSTTENIMLLGVDCKTITNQSHNKDATDTKQPNIRSRENNAKDYHVVILSLIPMFLMTLYWIYYMFLFCT